MSILRGHWQLIALVALIIALWQLPVIYPLKILVIFFHEAAHGLAAVLTGGRIEELSVSPAEGGHAVTIGGNSFLIISAGYLGSLAIGAILFAAALRSTWDRAIFGGLGVLLLVLTALYIRDLFPLAMGAVFGGIFLATARYLRAEFSDLALRVIGLTSMIYVPLDIFDDTLARPGVRSDARILAETFGGPGIMWGAMWLLLSVVVIWFTLRWTLRGPSNLRLVAREASET